MKNGDLRSPLYFAPLQRTFFLKSYLSRISNKIIVKNVPFEYIWLDCTPITQNCNPALKYWTKLLVTNRTRQPRNNPGIGFIKYTTFEYQRRLQDFYYGGIISTRRVGNFRCYFMLRFEGVCFFIIKFHGDEVMNRAYSGKQRSGNILKNFVLWSSANSIAM